MGTTSRTPTPTTKLSMIQAARIGRKMGVRGLRIYRDDIDRDLWQVVTPGRVQAHEPMTEADWRAFVAASGWIGESDDEPNDELFDTIRDHFSPEAVAAIHAHLQPVQVTDETVLREVQWFAQVLVKAVGGTDAMSRLLDEVGL